MRSRFRVGRGGESAIAYKLYKGEGDRFWHGVEVRSRFRGGRGREKAIANKLDKGECDPLLTPSRSAIAF